MERERQADADRVSLAGPDPEDVLRALLKVDPEDEPAEDTAEGAPDVGSALSGGSD